MPGPLPQPSPTDTYYPPSGFYFSVQLASPGGAASKLDMAFEEAAGIAVAIEPETVAEGGVNAYRHRLPTAPKYPDLVLKRGFVWPESPLFKWCQQTIQAGFAAPLRPQTVVLQLLAPDVTGGHNEILRQWSFHGAWPIKWSLADLNARKNEVLIETLTFAYRYFETA